MLPTTMKGLMVTKFGQPSEALKLCSDIPVPTLTDPNQILVSVHYAALNPFDWKLYTGAYGVYNKYSLRYKPPYHPCKEYSGKVVQVGDNVKNFQIGDNVFGQVKVRRGTAVQYLIVTEKDNDIYKVPKNMTLMEAASIQSAFETAWGALVRDANIKKNDRILILGGSTLCGIAGIQIAKHLLLCKDITVTSTQKELCLSVGADKVINYRKEKLENILLDAAFDIVYDCVGGKKSFNDCCKYNILKSNGMFVTICGEYDFSKPITISNFLPLIASRFVHNVIGNRKYVFSDQMVSKDILDILKFVEKNKVKIIIDNESPFELENYLKAFQKSMAYGAHGKLLLKLRSNL